MDKLQWFKFTPADWMMGKIIRCPEITQARFMRLCCLYWNKETELTEEDAIIEIEDEHFKILLKKKIINSDGVTISIDFLDEQFDKILETSKKASKAGKASAAKRKEKKQQAFNDRSTPVKKRSTDKIRKEKIREEVKEEEILTNFTNFRKSIGLKFSIKKLTLKETEILKELNKDYTRDEFGSALKAMFKDQWRYDNNHLLPKYFLNRANFEKFLNEYDEKAKPLKLKNAKIDYDKLRFIT